MTPNPGSDEAIKGGCRCPVLDNGHGQGCGWPSKDGGPTFWISGDCPMHRPELKQEGEDNAGSEGEAHS
jgi:hypothetical protein